MKLLISLVSTLIISVTLAKFCFCFEVAPDDVFEKGADKGLLAAFGDFNSDKRIDIFSINSSQSFHIILANDDAPYLRQSTLGCQMDKPITGLMPADFNGDSIMDILVTTSDSSLTYVTVIWGSLNLLNCANQTTIKMSNQPLVLDYNFDRVADIFGEKENGDRVVWYYNNGKFDEYKMQNFTGNKLKNPHSCSFVDLDGDMAADLLVTGEKFMEGWIHKDAFQWEFNITYPPDAKHIGQSTFMDINGDGTLEHLIPVCKDVNCNISSIMVYLPENGSLPWKTVFDNFNFQGKTWGFATPDSQPTLDSASSAISMKVGDFDLDGFPDILTILQRKGVEKRAFLFLNVPSSAHPYGRSFSFHSMDERELSKFSNVQVASFYDLNEDGLLDIILAVKEPKDGWWKMHVLQNSLKKDSYFLKVLVLNGLCDNMCPETNRIPYGTNQPGPFVKYSVLTVDGSPQSGCSSQMTQSAYFSLQVPYIVFGLGSTPNFVDYITVALPGTDVNRINKRDWTQIIPNSQMVVIPYPQNEPNHWKNKLFIAPSHLMYMTLFALAGTCLFVLFIVFVLHIQEKRADKRERMQEAHRFHFDAM